MFLYFTRQQFGQKIQTFHQFPLKKRKSPLIRNIYVVSKTDQRFWWEGGGWGEYIREEVTSHIILQITFNICYYLLVFSSRLWLLPLGNVRSEAKVTRDWRVPCPRLPSRWQGVSGDIIWHQLSSKQWPRFLNLWSLCFKFFHLRAKLDFAARPLVK